MPAAEAAPLEAARKRRIARILCAGEVFACCGNTPLISTRAPLVFAYFAGDAGRGTWC